MAQQRHRALPRSLAPFADSMRIARPETETDDELSQWLQSLPREEYLAFLYYARWGASSMLQHIWDRGKFLEAAPDSRKLGDVLYALIRQSMELGVCQQLTPEQLAQAETYWPKDEDDPAE